MLLRLICTNENLSFDENPWVATATASGEGSGGALIEIEGDKMGD
jgi:hypothetical protein